VYELRSNTQKVGSIQNVLKQDILWSLSFNIALKYAIWNVQENQVGLKLNGTHQLLVYTDDMNILRGNIGTIKKIIETLTDATKEVGLDVDAENTKYVYCCLVTRMQGKIITQR
jgi:hypothetical protein